jgi:hypothetical protein
MRARRRGTRWARRLLLTAAWALAAVLLLALPTLLTGVQGLLEARRELTRGAELARALHLEPADQAFAVAGRHAARARARLRSWPAGPAAALPLVGGNVRAARTLAGAAELAAAAAQQAIDAVAAFPREPSGKAVAMSAGSIDVAAWPAAGERLERAAELMRAALGAAERLDGLLLPPVARARDQFVRRAAQGVSMAERGAAAASLVPLAFGADHPRTWFLAVQNPVELRATGGMMGAFGLLSADAGRLRLLRFDSNIALPAVSQPPDAPAEYTARYGRFQPLRFWQNVNMTPDFPTAAALMAGMWQRATGQAVDGVIAVDAVGLRALMAIAGPLSVPGVGEVTPETFLSLVLNDAYVRFPEKADRVDFLMEVGRAVWDRLLGGQLPDLRTAGSKLAEAAANKHFLLWIPGEEAALARLGVAGDVGPPRAGEDHLMVVGQNAAANKVDYYARRSVTYRVEIGEDGGVHGRLRVRLENRSPASGLPAYVAGPHVQGDPPGLNRSYLSVYLPPRSGVLAARVDGQRVGVESQRERGLSVVSRFLEVAPGGSSTLELQIEGEPVRPGEYRLVVPRQPSLEADTLRLEVKIPPEFSPAGATDGMRIEGTTLVWEGPLASDREFLVRFRQSPLQRTGIVAALRSLLRRGATARR